MIDICLIVEGTYPLGLGGIATWVHELMSGLPAVDFALVRVGCALPPRAQWTFAPPDNAVWVGSVADTDRLRVRDIEEWAQATAAKLPRARCYHAVGAGLAGALARAASAQFAAPFVLSEHASYADELALGSLTLETGRRVFSDVMTADANALRESVVANFRTLATGLYRSADRVIALYAERCCDQIAAGAEPDKTRVIANGVRVPAVAADCWRRRDPRFTVGFVGRVHPIKGAARYLRAVRIIAESRPAVRARLAGPIDCDENYAEECRQLAATLGERLHWCGPVSREAWDWDLDCLISASDSEAQPFVVLEALARGIPVVATDVGDCRTLVLGDGSPAEVAGAIVRRREPAALANAVLDLARDPDRARRWGAQGRRRIEQDYTLAGMLAGYEQLYREVSALPAPGPSCTGAAAQPGSANKGTAGRDPSKAGDRGHSDAPHSDAHSNAHSDAHSNAHSDAHSNAHSDPHSKAPDAAQVGKTTAVALGCKPSL